MATRKEGSSFPAQNFLCIVFVFLKYIELRTANMYFVGLFREGPLWLVASGSHIAYISFRCS